MFFEVSLVFVTLEQISCTLFIDRGLYSKELDTFNRSSFRPFVEEEVIGLAQCARKCVHQISCESAIFHKDLLSCFLMTLQYFSDISTSLLRIKDDATDDSDEESLEISQSMIPKAVDPSPCWYRTCPQRHSCVTLSSGKSHCVMSHCEVRPFSVENGVVRATNGYSVGSVIHFICNEGYILNGTSNVNTTAQLTCSTLGFWEGEEPLCDKIIIYCGDLPDLQHGQILPGGSREGTVRTYICDSLYYMEGPSNITCTPSGEWTIVEAVCKPEMFCGILPILPNGNVSAGNHREDTNRTYTCDNDFYMEGKDTITCQSDGTWSALEAICKPEMFCGTLPILSNGNVSTGNHRENTNRTYTCSNDFYIEGKATITCNSDGTWSALEAICKVEMFCGTLPSLPNGVVGTGNNREGTVRTYTCNSGYYIDGDDFITCQSDRTWSALVATCKLENFCPEPVASIPHGSITDGTKREGATRTYTCSSGYFMDGSGSITCQSSGVWTTLQEQCKSCLPANDPTGLYYTGDLAETVNGVTCGYWTMVNKYPSLWSHDNKCRNPDGDVRPWCALNVVGTQIIWEYCDLNPCP